MIIICRCWKWNCTKWSLVASWALWAGLDCGFRFPDAVLSFSGRQNLAWRLASSTPVSSNKTGKKNFNRLKLWWYVLECRSIPFSKSLSLCPNNAFKYLRSIPISAPNVSSKKLREDHLPDHLPCSRFFWERLGIILPASGVWADTWPISPPPKLCRPF